MSFQEIGNHRRAKPWWRTDKDMNMIFIRFHCQERQPVLLTTLGYEPLGFFLDLARQHTAAVLRYPHQVIGNAIVGIPGFPHLQNVLIHGIIIP